LETGSGRSAEASYRYALSVEVGLYAGSFDPVHLGHMALIAAAAEKLDRMVVAVAVNPQKRSPMFSVQERLEMLSGACQHLGNVRVAAHGGLLIGIAAQVGATALVRSAGKEHVEEEQMAYLNGCEGLRTLLVPSDPATAFISSSRVRTLIGVGALDAVAELVPPGVTDRAKARENTSLSR
jgi:pantetheine-phosphate adenylyltransferase